jgi:hypothetical protein
MSHVPRPKQTGPVLLHSTTRPGRVEITGGCSRRAIGHTTNCKPTVVIKDFGHVLILCFTGQTLIVGPITPACALNPTSHRRLTMLAHRLLAVFTALLGAETHRALAPAGPVARRGFLCAALNLDNRQHYRRKRSIADIVRRIWVFASLQSESGVGFEYENNQSL